MLALAGKMEANPDPEEEETQSPWARSEADSNVVMEFRIYT